MYIKLNYGPIQRSKICILHKYRAVLTDLRMFMRKVDYMSCVMKSDTFSVMFMYYLTSFILLDKFKLIKLRQNRIFHLVFDFLGNNHML